MSKETLGILNCDTFKNWIKSDFPAIYNDIIN
mgnify:CR=1 FL=1|jgi:hypothetical protein